MSDKPSKGRKNPGGRRISDSARTPGAAKSSSRSVKPAHVGTSRSAAGAAGAGAGAKASASRSAKATAAGGAKPKKNLLNYPRAGKSGVWRWLPSLRLITATLALMVLLVLGAGAWLYNDTDIPEASDVAIAQTSRVYFSDGETLMGEFSELNRTILPGDEIPQNVKDAVVASEDSTFYENRGISPRGILRAFLNNLQGGARQGGSTITQQYVENYYTGTVTSYSGKVREMIMAVKTDQEISKDEILARYLNTIYFGRSAYGVQAASQAYFGKDAKDLTDAEAALLVAVIPAPSAYDPAANPEVAQTKWARVIERQVNETKTMTKEEADALTFPETIEYAPQNKLGGTNGYLLTAVKAEMEKNGITPDQVDTGGYTIVSTIDPRIQQNTIDAVNALPEDRPENNKVGTMTLDPSTGAIRAMYGGPDYIQQGRNDATQSRMQAGSTFKAFTLVAAIDDGYSLRSTWNGNSPETFSGWTVKNFNNISYGAVNLLKATENSINTAYADLNIDMGPEKTRAAAIKLGLPENTPGLDAEAPNVLGTASPTVQEMATAYATLASGGIKREPYIVQKVTNPDGSSAFEHKDAGERVIEEGVATNATVALQGPTSGSGSANQVQRAMSRPVAGKTGTSESFRSAWFVGYTPQLVTAVGMFQPSADGSTEEALTPFGGERYISGGTIPTDLWLDIMRPSMEGMEVMNFPSEAKIQRQSGGNRSSGSTQSPTQAPSPTQTEETTQPEETEEPTENPQPTEQPTQQPAPQPTTPAPTTPQPTPTGGNVQPTRGPEDG